jgi:hypothetical protein
MAARVIGEAIVYGLHQPKPLAGFPSGRARVKMRNRTGVIVYIKTNSGIRAFTAKEQNGKWVPGWEIGSNVRVTI